MILDGDFRGGCCILIGEHEGVMDCRPDTPESVTGNQWFHFCARLSGEPGSQSIRLHWPPDDQEIKASIEYGGSDQYSLVLDRTLNLSVDGLNWQRIEPVILGDMTATFTVHKTTDQPVFIGAGILWTRANLERLLEHAESHPDASVEVLARSERGNPMCAISIGPRDGGAGTFYLQALQHRYEYAGGRVVESAIRFLLSDEGRPLREKYRWRFVPVVNMDGFDHWPEDFPTNINRDWGTWNYNESKAIGDWLCGFQNQGERILHGLDLHMGWSQVDRAESSLTVYAEPSDVCPAWAIERQTAFGRHCFESIGWSDYLWPAKHRGGLSFSHWAIQRLGVPFQTLENSRHLWLDKKSGTWVPIEQSHEEELGRGLVLALASFPWGGEG